jgi:hypothetical protein
LTQKSCLGWKLGLWSTDLAPWRTKLCLVNSFFCCGDVFKTELLFSAIYTLFGKLFQAFPEKVKVDCPNVVPTVVKLIEVSIDRAYVTRTEIEMIGMVK